MTRLQAAWAGWYRTQADSFDAMADRLINEAEFTHALYARQESKRLAVLADRILLLKPLDSPTPTV